MTGPYKPPRYKPRGWGEELRRRQHNAGMSDWELADLLGVHEHDISLDHLPNQPLHVVLELARRLDLHPGDLSPYAADVYDHPRYLDVQQQPEPAPGTDTDAVAVLNALAHAAAHSPPTSSPSPSAGTSTASPTPSNAPGLTRSSPGRTPCGGRPPRTSP
ncbi:hypothetical protein AR457_39225 [Streptomyces agglomeratus]|uniref:Uncharacterized protein n=1 Tax=Streptomyces agglomeratus TaxID=285458 RepID=A0A1E5PHE6_9ACTN|nr:hypothetical protein [Streptomyces agglomeratus]OEJ21960.1 hypothetical protein AR457_39225 [Streptomyces agglomeratus]OEJ28947.1 hypothetical protein AS594_35530 [Streptomyces agglomeratus]